MLQVSSNIVLASGQYSDPAITGSVLSLFDSVSDAQLQAHSAHALRKLYPDHSLVMTESSVIGLPGVNYIPLSPSEMVTNVIFVPLAERSGMGPGVLVDQIKFAGLAANWEVIVSIDRVCLSLFLNPYLLRDTTLSYIPLR